MDFRRKNNEKVTRDKGRGTRKKKFCSFAVSVQSGTCSRLQSCSLSVPMHHPVSCTPFPTVPSPLVPRPYFISTRNKDLYAIKSPSLE